MIIIVIIEGLVLNSKSKWFFIVFFIWQERKFHFLINYTIQAQTCLLHSKQRFKNLKEYLFFRIAFYTLFVFVVVTDQSLQKTNSSHNIFFPPPFSNHSNFLFITHTSCLLSSSYIAHKRKQTQQRTHEKQIKIDKNYWLVNFSVFFIFVLCINFIYHKIPAFGIYLYCMFHLISNNNVSFAKK